MSGTFKFNGTITKFMNEKGYDYSYVIIQDDDGTVMGAQIPKSLSCGLRVGSKVSVQGHFVSKVANNKYFFRLYNIVDSVVTVSSGMSDGKPSGRLS